MALFSALTMTRWKRNAKGQRFVTSNFALGIGATVTVVRSMLTGYSFCSLCGSPMTNITQVLPFVLLGIGLDDSFILVGAFYQIDDAVPFRKRLKETARIACASITVTTLTDCLAFAFAAISQIPGIRWFGFYAVVCVFIDFVYQITFFVALMALDNRRQQSERYDVSNPKNQTTRLFLQSRDLQPRISRRVSRWSRRKVQLSKPTQTCC